LLIWSFCLSFCTYKDIVPHRSSAQMSCREEFGVSFVALGILEPQIARHWFRSAAISSNLKNSVGRSWFWRAISTTPAGANLVNRITGAGRAFFRGQLQFICGHPR
jgi:hypothetical protein